MEVSAEVVGDGNGKIAQNPEIAEQNSTPLLDSEIIDSTSTSEVEKVESVNETTESDVLASDLEPVEIKNEKPSTPLVKKRPAELVKYWQTVKESPSDFTGWTYLLQFVEQENNPEYAREAFDAFFSHYPYCYGYWKKYADMEKKTDCLDRCKQVYENGVEAIKLSVDLWIHYINFYSSYHDKDEDCQSKIRDLFARAIDVAGMEFRSDKLWDKYIDWETKLKNYKNVVGIYDKLLAIPTQLYSHHFDNFCTFVQSHHPKDILPLDDFLNLRKEVVQSAPEIENQANDEDDAPPPGLDVPPGVEDDTPPGEESGPKPIDEKEIAAVRENVIAIRQAIHKATEEEVSKRWTFEEGIRRPYFHVKPLEKGQIKNWKDYLDFEILAGNHKRTVLLFERCMIACAQYEDMWIKYAEYLEEHDKEAASDVYRRACAIHLPTKPYLHLHWATFEEGLGNIDLARSNLSNIEKMSPGLVMMSMRRINFERRQKQYTVVEELFNQYIDTSDSKEATIYFSLKYARFLTKIQHDVDKAKEILLAIIEKYSDNEKLFLQLVDNEFSRCPMEESSVLAAFEKAMNSDLSVESKILFSQRKMEFLEDFGEDISKIMTAYDHHQQFVKDAGNDCKKRRHSDGKIVDESSQDSKKSKTSNGSVTTATDPNLAYNYNQWGNYAQTGGYGYQQQGWY